MSNLPVKILHFFFNFDTIFPACGFIMLVPVTLGSIIQTLEFSVYVVYVSIILTF